MDCSKSQFRDLVKITSVMSDMTLHVLKALTEV